MNEPFAVKKLASPFSVSLHMLLVTKKRNEVKSVCSDADMVRVDAAMAVAMVADAAVLLY